MIRNLIMFNLASMDDLPAMERWYPRYHAAELIARSPGVARHVSYRAVPPPPGAEEYGYHNYRVTEVVRFQEAGPPPGLPKGTLALTPELRGRPHHTMVTVPFYPTEDFMGSEVTPDEKTILRWFIFFKYPVGVPVEEGEKWYVDVHSKEVMRQPGLTRYFSWRTLPGTGVAWRRPGDPPPKLWHRAVEQWYEHHSGWVKSIIDSPPKYTKPPWAKYDKYPFLEPYIDFVSTFILERPDINFLKDVVPYV